MVSSPFSTSKIKYSVFFRIYFFGSWGQLGIHWGSRLHAKGEERPAKAKETILLFGFFLRDGVKRWEKKKREESMKFSYHQLIMDSPSSLAWSFFPFPLQSLYERRDPLEGIAKKRRTEKSKVIVIGGGVNSWKKAEVFLGLHSRLPILIEW